MEYRLRRIARREQYLHRGAQPAAFFGDSPARHAARHDNIREQEVDAVILPEKRDRAHAVRHLKNAIAKAAELGDGEPRSEEHTSELQSLMRISYAVFCLKKKKPQKRKSR